MDAGARGKLRANVGSRPGRMPPAAALTSLSISWLVGHQRLNRLTKFVIIYNFLPKLRTLEEKLNWIFDVFDTDGSGSIDQSELYNIVHGLFCMAGIEVPSEVLVARSEVIHTYVYS